MAKSDSDTLSYWDTASNDAQNELEDEEGDIFQPDILASQGEPLADAADENDNDENDENALDTSLQNSLHSCLMTSSLFINFSSQSK